MGACCEMEPTSSTVPPGASPGRTCSFELDPPSTVRTFTFVVPEGAAPGAKLRMDLAGLGRVQIEVPEGAVAGQTVSFNVNDGNVNDGNAPSAPSSTYRWHQPERSSEKGHHFFVGPKFGRSGRCQTHNLVPGTT